MTNFAIQINRLKSQNKDIRYDACEELRVAESLPPAAMTALEQVKNDADPLVADAASRALLAHPQVEAVSQPLIPPLSQPAGSAWTGHAGVTGAAEDVAQMYRSIRSWALVSVVLGAISLFSPGGLDPVWGVLLVLVGLLSLKVKIPGMFALYAVVMGWVAIMNALSVSGIFWLIFAGMQVFWTISIVRQLRKYRRLPLQEMYESQDWPADLPAPQDATRISGRFAVASSLLALPSLLIPVFACLGIIGFALMQGEASNPAPAEQTQSFDWFTYLVTGVVDIAVLSLGLGSAALVSGTRRRRLALAGASVSALTLVSWLVFLAFVIVFVTIGMPQLSG